MKNEIKLEIMPQLRPCIIYGDQKCLFHCWEQWAKVSPKGNQVSCILGIVEDESGCILEVPAEKIRFLDNPMADMDMTDRFDNKEGEQNELV